MMKKVIAMLLCCILLGGCTAARPPASAPADPPVPESSPLPSQTASPEPVTPTPEVSSAPIPEPDPVYQQVQAMTTEQKVGQVLLAGIEGLTAGEDAVYAVRTLQVGSVILFRRNVDTCAQAADLVTQLKVLNGEHVPLFIAMDEEGGPVSRMPADVTDLPSAYTYGKTGDGALCFRLGQALAAQCAALGVNVDFAPVADIWSNPDNTVIGKRSFGTEADTVSALMLQTARGLSASGVIPVVKHFPGHGDTAVDSHYDLPVVTKTVEELEELELKPFRAAVEAGLPAVMVAHLLLTEVDDSRPATLSPAVVTGLLREELGFDGVVFTDDLTMGAISNTYGMGEAAVLAFEAGCDVLLVCHGRDNLTAAYEALLEAVYSGRVSHARLDESVYRILALKAEYALTNDPVPEPDPQALNALLADALPN